MKPNQHILITLLLMASSISQASNLFTITDLQQAWANANYQLTGDNQEVAFEALVKDARSLATKHNDQPEYKVWLAIILSSDAGATGGFSALSKVKESRQLLEEVEKVNPSILNGSVYTSLGSLYYKVPGWPVAFGNDSTAEKYLKKALSLNPNGIDPNYFYGDFLIEKDNAKDALTYLTKALEAPARSSRPVADQGRKDDIQKAIVKAQKMLAEASEDEF